MKFLSASFGRGGGCDTIDTGEAHAAWLAVLPEKILSGLDRRGDALPKARSTVAHLALLAGDALYVAGGSMSGRAHGERLRS